MEIINDAMLYNDAFYLGNMLAATFHPDSTPDRIGVISGTKAVGDPPDRKRTTISIALADGSLLEDSPNKIKPLYLLSCNEAMTIPSEWKSKFWMEYDGFPLYVVGQEVALDCNSSAT